MLRELDGVWTRGTVRGHLIERDWGTAAGFPEIVVVESGPEVEVHIFTSRDLPDHWGTLDEFEGSEYKRIPTWVRSGGTDVAAHLYALADENC